jgi:hypothetical protein
MGSTVTLGYRVRINLKRIHALLSCRHCNAHSSIVYWRVSVETERLAMEEELCK